MDSNIPRGGQGGRWHLQDLGQKTTLKLGRNQTLVRDHFDVLKVLKTKLTLFLNIKHRLRISNSK
jgi:hypothetical protein